MHEVAVAGGILEIAERYAADANAAVVLEIVIDIGDLSGVVTEALEFAMESVKMGTILEHAAITINEIPAVARCLFCEAEFPADSLYCQCPHCQEYNINIINGKELKVQSLTVE